MSESGTSLQDRMERARTLLRAGDCEGAEATLAILAGADAPAAKRDLARLLLRAGEAGEAEKLLVEVCASPDAAAGHWALLADAQTELGKDSQALKAITRAIAMEPDKPQFAARKIEFLISSQEFDAAKVVASGVVAQFPDFVQGHVLSHHLHKSLQSWTKPPPPIQPPPPLPPAR